MKDYFDEDSMAIPFIHKEKLTCKKHSAHVILQACCAVRLKLSNIICFWLWATMTTVAVISYQENRWQFILKQLSLIFILFYPTASLSFSRLFFTPPKETPNSFIYSVFLLIYSPQHILYVEHVKPAMSRSLDYYKKCSHSSWPVYTYTHKKKKCVCVLTAY